MDPLFFYWLIAAVVAMPIVVIVRGITADKARKKDEPESGPDHPAQ